MPAALVALLMVAFGTSARGEGSGSDTAPSYTAGSIVNATSGRTGPFAPNNIVTIYGARLAYGEEAASEANVRDRLLPVRLARVEVLAMRGALGTPLPLLYVGLGQINFVVPDSLDPGTLEVRVVREGTAGPAVTLPLQEAAPELFPGKDGWVVATHPDGSLVTAEKPARPGGVIVLYATGLGRTVQRLRDGEIPAIPPFTLAGLYLKNQAEVQVLLAGQPIEAARVFYAGLTPGIAALYQLNFHLPDTLPENPEIRIAIGQRMSGEGLRLAAGAAPKPDPE